MDGNRIHAFGSDVLADHDAVALADMVRRREVSPVELARAAIDRVERINGALNAVSWPDYERALSTAARPRNGLFAGVPTFVKDNVDLRGLPTGHGSQAVPKIPADRDGSFTKQYLSLGLSVLGKTTMPEFGFNCTAESQSNPPTRNPWHTGFSSGGSSGGSAALVAAGAVPLAHANDGGGSIRIPAAWCGLVGLKPSRGRLVQTGIARVLPVNRWHRDTIPRNTRQRASRPEWPRVPPAERST
jgi:amidase